MYCQKNDSMINIEFASIRELIKAFPDEQTCINHLEELRWSGNVVSPFDATSKVYKCAGNKYKCKNTGKYFNVRTGTLFDNTKIELQTWFLAIYIITSHKKGISSVQLAKDLDVTQKTAWFMNHRIRNCFGMSNEQEGDVIEMDETFVGGKTKNKSKAKRKELSAKGRGYVHQTMVVGMLERGAGVKAKVVIPANPTMTVLHGLIKDNLKAGTTVITDGHGGYKNMPSEYKHEIVEHSKNIYVRGPFHTNSIEGFWSILKRGIFGIYHQVSEKHLQRYVDEFSFRYNSRSIDECKRFNLLLANSNNRLTYKSLING